ncbi:MarR family transcriptional regulator [Streptomyces sp. NPDC091265]|uniref:MarR family transcriptional regulator n=1 Tax=unclassified Streptomyces TaxID=2593676 RepID=UPI00344D8B92
MATVNFSSAPRPPECSPPYARANPGYGKRSAPSQLPPRADDFALLPERERFIAGYVDKLPDGAAMDIKSLAKSLPLYGQMAVGSALRALGVAGYLRHVRCPAAGGDQVRWVTRTFWSRTARDNEWWGTFLAAEEACTAPEPVSSLPVPAPATGSVPAPLSGSALGAVEAEDESEDAQTPSPARAPVLPRQRNPQPAPVVPSPAYAALARLGRVEPRLTLSAADCTVLEELAAAWLARGVDTEYLTQALVAGLPERVDSPVGFLRRRLRDKIPPHIPAAPATGVAPPPRLMVECSECRTPGRPEALPDGLCQQCRTPVPDTVPDTVAPAEAPVERDIHALVGNLRDLLKAP